jgi:Uma2 family endonuclease
VATFPIYRLSVAQYHAMGEHRILTADDRVELIHGVLVAKMSKNPPHRLATTLVRDALTAVAPPAKHVQSQEPITLADSEPEPDVAVIQGHPRDYSSRHPEAREVALVAEVADSTLADDRAIKKPLYAGANIPTYWIVNLIDNQLEVYTDPAGHDYAASRVLGPNDDVPVVLDGQEVGRIPVRDLLP